MSSADDQPSESRPRLNVEEVVVSSFRLFRRKPILLVPEIITTLIFVIPLMFVDLDSSESIMANLPMFGGMILLGIITLPVIQGMYPLMVKNVMEGRDVEMSEAFSKSLSRFPSLIGAFILVGLLVLAGAILIIPAILFVLWYAYTIPSIMIENLGARGGMSASKRFGRTVKLKTFLIILIIAIIGTVGSIAEIIPVAGLVISAIVSLIVAVWGSISISYAYLKYGMVTPAST